MKRLTFDNGNAIAAKYIDIPDQLVQDVLTAMDENPKLRFIIDLVRETEEGSPAILLIAVDGDQGVTIADREKFLTELRKHLVVKDKVAKDNLDVAVITTLFASLVDKETPIAVQTLFGIMENFSMDHVDSAPVLILSGVVDRETGAASVTSMDRAYVRSAFPEVQKYCVITTKETRSNETEITVFGPFPGKDEAIAACETCEATQGGDGLEFVVKGEIRTNAEGAKSLIVIRDASSAFEASTANPFIGFKIHKDRGFTVITGFKSYADVLSATISTSDNVEDVVIIQHSAPFLSLPLKDPDEISPGF